MHTDQPLVSIIIPTFNRANLIGETLDSVLAQTYPHWECIIVDDGSTDHTDEVVGAYVQKDARFRYHHRPDSHKSGGNGARNFGFEMSKGDFLIFLDSDDVLSEKCISGRENRMQQEDADMYINTSGLFDERPGDNNYLWNEIRPTENINDLIKRFLNTDMPWQTNGVLWNRSFFEQSGGWDEELIAWQDWDLHVRALFQNPKIKMFKEVDNYVRMSERNSVGKKINSPPYYHSIYLILKRIYIIIKNDKKHKEYYAASFEKFKIQKLIFLPLDKGLKKVSFSFLFKNFFINEKYRFEFLRLYICQLMSKSAKLKSIFLKKVIFHQREKFKSNSTHLKFFKH
jgi:glycosyltransferase involved in cell wall biosynthesis